ncbi:MAG TPA: hypothetical protein DEF35_17070 [Paenibacillus sp.]|nr:hypothetical protein P364_0120715 [Paenibacillus sp. MAEPY2]KGP87071.1 hypothetical protein P363_0114130 [Paenibacillus sp. MAEPY1]OZQ58859.1 hypothetical protein CA599_31495 [Paenibacillus taichungensis]HBU83331.1 hypothetical protein [Paenibacillus sp.]
MFLLPISFLANGQLILTLSSISMFDISDLINHAFKKKLLTNNIKSTTSYELGNMTVMRQNLWILNIRNKQLHKQLSSE